MSILSWLKNSNADAVSASTSSNEKNEDSNSVNLNIVRKRKLETNKNDFDGDNLPDCWTPEMYTKKLEEYKWLQVKNQKIGCSICNKAKCISDPFKKQGIQLSHDWINADVGYSGNTDKEKRQSLRKKIFKHKNSQAHQIAEKIESERTKQKLENNFDNLELTKHQTTQHIFRTVYNIIKKARPFTDLPLDVDLQQLNGISMGRILQSDHACRDIAIHIANEMKKSIVRTVIDNNSKIGVLIDESTSVSKLTVLVVCIKVYVQSRDHEITDKQVYSDIRCTTFFLDLIELEATTSSCITASLLSCLEKHGFTDDYLSNHFVSFASDGASNMIGKKSGVATLLLNKYPHVIIWHCANHRLELAVEDVTNEVAGINHFKIFFDKLYSVYSASPKNQRELKFCAADLELQLLSIGRILSTRWVASSFRSVRAVWNNFKALYMHFEQASNDTSRLSSERSKFLGLKERLSEENFVHNLGLLYDALSELSYMSLELEKREITLSNAHKLISRQIRVLESMIENPGTYLKAANISKNDSNFQGVELRRGKRVQQINQGQFFQSLAENLRSRLFTFSSSHVSRTSGSTPLSSEYDDLMKSLAIFDTQNWPPDMNIRYGEEEVQKLCIRFKLDYEESIRGFREYLENSSQIPKTLKPLITSIKTLIVSTAECERIFSAMNIIHSDIRNQLKVETVSSLLFIKCVGPPLRLFNPVHYVTSWIKSGRRDADYTQCNKRINTININKITSEYEVLWSHL